MARTVVICATAGRTPAMPWPLRESVPDGTKEAGNKRHDGLGIDAAKAVDERKHAVLAEPRAEGGDKDAHEGEHEVGRGADRKHDGGQGQDGKGDAVERERNVDAVWIVCIALSVREVHHHGEVGEGANAENHGLEVIEDKLALYEDANQRKLNTGTAATSQTSAKRP